MLYYLAVRQAAAPFAVLPARGGVRRCEPRMKQIAQLLMRFGGALLILWSALVTTLFFALTVVWATAPDTPLKNMGGWLASGWGLLALGLAMALLGVLLDQIIDRDGQSVESEAASILRRGGRARI